MKVVPFGGRPMALVPPHPASRAEVVRYSVHAGHAPVRQLKETTMSRGMTPAILDMVNERARDKLRCTLAMRRRGRAASCRPQNDEEHRRKQPA